MHIDGNIYNYLNTALTPKRRNTTHKSSELKDVYNSMVRYNKNSPLYLIPITNANQEYMINIKEAALTLKDVTDSFASETSELYSKKLLHSDNDEAISGTLGKGYSGQLPDSLSISLNQLASEQINTGNYIRSNGRSFTPGTYSFSISTLQGISRFSVTVDSDDTNRDVQSKLMQYINNRSLDVTASVITEGDNSTLMLSSTDTGVPATDDGLYFSVTENDKKNFIDILGIDIVTKEPANSVFYINDELHTANSNHISINQTIELDFHNTAATPVTISFVPDSDIAMQQIDMFVDAYNSLIELSDIEEQTNVGSRNLFKDISGIVNNHRDELESAGLIINNDNSIKKDDTLLIESIKNGSLSTLFKDMSSLHSDIESATNRMALDPMAYINKLLVTYPNTNNKFNAAYNQSLYSGLMFNNYV